MNMQARLSRILVLGASLLALSFAIEVLADIDDSEGPPSIGSPLPQCEDLGIFVPDITGARLVTIGNPNTASFKQRPLCSINSTFIRCDPKAKTFIQTEKGPVPNPAACTGEGALEALPSTVTSGSDPWWCTTNPLTGKTTCVCQDTKPSVPGCQP